jgi:hypothetical protein
MTTSQFPNAPSTKHPAPMPGRLPVTYDTGLGPVTKPLADVPAGTWVEVTATVRAVTSRPPGRALLVLADEDGHSAYAFADTAGLIGAFRTTGQRPMPGCRVQVRGEVFRRITSQPATIDVTALRVVT